MNWILHFTFIILQYSVPCTKYDRHGYKPRERLLVITTGALYLLEAKENKLKQKHRFSLKEIQGLHVSPNNDNLMLIQIPPENAKKDKVFFLRNSRPWSIGSSTLSHKPDLSLYFICYCPEKTMLHGTFLFILFIETFTFSYQCVLSILGKSSCVIFLFFLGNNIKNSNCIIVIFNSRFPLWYSFSILSLLICLDPTNKWINFILIFLLSGWLDHQCAKCDWGCDQNCIREWQQWDSQNSWNR